MPLTQHDRAFSIRKFRPSAGRGNRWALLFNSTGTGECHMTMLLDHRYLKEERHSVPLLRMSVDGTQCVEAVAGAQAFSPFLHELMNSSWGLGDAWWYHCGGTALTTCRNTCRD